MRTLVVCGLIACGTSADSPDAMAPDATPRSCKTFGPLVRAGTISRPGGAPVSASGVESDPTIVREGDRLRMWFTTASRTPPHDVRIAYAESTDGMLWTNVIDSVLPPSPGTFDEVGVETAAVAKIGDEYKLFYTANAPPDGANRYGLGVARSPDGLTWTKLGMAFAPIYEWEKPFCDDDACTRRVGGLLEPSLVIGADRMHMWYAALGVLDGIPSYRIAHATSTNGIDWSREPLPVFSAGPTGAWDEVLVSHTNVVADPGGGFHLFYFGSSIADYERCEAAGGCLLTPGAIGHAFSTDGHTWSRDPNNPILKSEAGGFDAWSTGGPMALIEDGVLRLWFFGNPTVTSLDLRIGYASAKCDQ